MLLIEKGRVIDPDIAGRRVIDPAAGASGRRSERVGGRGGDTIQIREGIDRNLTEIRPVNIGWSGCRVVTVDIGEFGELNERRSRVQARVLRAVELNLRSQRR